MHILVLFFELIYVTSIKACYSECEGTHNTHQIQNCDATPSPTQSDFSHIKHAKMSTNLGVHIRSPIARSLYNKLMQDELEKGQDHSYWYSVRMEELSEDLHDKFLQLFEDEETKDFLSNCYEKSDWLFTQLYHTLAKAFLGWFMTQTSINGWLGRGSMFVFSNAQFQDLLGITDDTVLEKLLDLGAGDGMVTRLMQKHFNEVYVTETSRPMVWKLEEMDYQVLGVDTWSDGNHLFDVVSCLNLLDRCDKPMTILNQIKTVLKPDTGRLIVALVFPFQPYVEFGRKDHKPTELIHVGGHTFEEQVSMLVKNVFEPAGFVLEKFSRVPYLCEGDWHHSFYVLNDAVFVLRLPSSTLS